MGAYLLFEMGGNEHVQNGLRAITCWSSLSRLSCIWGMSAMEAATHCNMLLSWGSRVTCGGPRPRSLTSEFTITSADLGACTWVLSIQRVPAAQEKVAHSRLIRLAYFCNTHFHVLFCFFFFPHWAISKTDRCTKCNIQQSFAPQAPTSARLPCSHSRTDPMRSPSTLSVGCSDYTHTHTHTHTRTHTHTHHTHIHSLWREWMNEH